MAEKGFGVKEVNLIGPSGTPTITSPNNLNLNAVNVAISTNVSIGGTLSVTGNVSVGGTLTYEDVTNIDSVGIVTAREGVFIPDNKELKIGNTAGSPDTKIFHNGSKTRLVSSVQYDMDADIIDIHNAAANAMKARFLNSSVELYENNTKRFETTSSGATVTGTLTATTFSGSGASLTNLPVSDSDIQVAYTVTANGSSAYRFAGNGVVSTADNPDLYLIRGQKYRFINNSGGSHPFQIRESSGGSAYSTGVTNNGAASGNIDFAPTYDSPAQLVYQCTSHGGMVGNIYLRDAAGGNTNVGVTTFSGQITASDHINLASTKKLSMAGDVFKIYHSTNAAIINESGDFIINQNVSNKRIKISTGSGPTESVRITPDGKMKVGFINNVDPTTVFDVMASAINQDIVRFTGANYNRGLKISTAVSGSINDALIKYDADSQNSAGQHAFLTDGTERLRINSSGKVILGNNGTTFGNAAVQAFIQHGNTAGESGFSSVDTTSVAAGVGGEIAFHGKYNTGAQDYAYFGHIRGTKENATAGNTACALKFHTRPNATAPIERLRITSDGKIGVNATTTALIAPTYTLDLGGNDGVLDTSEQNTLRIRCNNGGTAIRVGSGGGGSQVVLIRVDGNSASNNCLGESDSSNFGASITYRGDRSGNENSLGIYMDNATNASQVEALNLRQNGDYIFGGSSYSDRDQKENITSLPGTALDKITQLIPRTWNWKPEYHDIPTDRIFGGFIAQEVLPHIPSIVRGTDGQGDMSLDYQGLLAWTIKALTELKTENDNLKARVNTLESS